MNMESGREVCVRRFRKTSLRRRPWSRGLKELERNGVPGEEHPGRGVQGQRPVAGQWSSQKASVAAAECSRKTRRETRSETSVRGQVIEGFAGLPQELGFNSECDRHHLRVLSRRIVFPSLYFKKMTLSSSTVIQPSIQFWFISFKFFSVKHCI